MRKYRLGIQRLSPSVFHEVLPYFLCSCFSRGGEKAIFEKVSLFLYNQKSLENKGFGKNFWVLLKKVSKKFFYYGKSLYLCTVENNEKI